LKVRIFADIGKNSRSEDISGKKQTTIAKYSTVWFNNQTSDAKPNIKAQQLRRTSHG